MGEVEEIIGTSEAAELLQVSAREVRRKASEGILPAFRVDGPVRPEWRFRRTDVIGFLQQQAAVASDGRTEGLSVRHIERVVAVQEETIEAIRGLGDLRTAIATSTAAQDEATAATVQLVETLLAQQAERDRLRDELTAARATIDELRDELQRERRLSWWQRLTGRT